MDTIKLHLGCGPHIFPGWHNLDLEPGPGGMVHDLRQPLPYPTESVDFIFTEHFIEHLTREEGARFLAECYRVLNPGGIIRISTPDLGWVCVQYQTGKIHDFAPTWTPKTPAQFMNEAMRLWGHQFLYDTDELSDALTEAGFHDQRRASHSLSEFDVKELECIEVRPDHNDIIVEAQK